MKINGSSSPTWKIFAQRQNARNFYWVTLVYKQNKQTKKEADNTDAQGQIKNVATSIGVNVKSNMHAQKKINLVQVNTNRVP